VTDVDQWECFGRCLIIDDDAMMLHQIVVLLLIADYFAKVDAKGKH